MAKAGRGGDAREGFALVVGARGRAVQVHLDVQVGDVCFFDRDVQGGRAVCRCWKRWVERMPLRLTVSRPSAGLKGDWTRMLGHVAGLVGFFVGDQGELLPARPCARAGSCPPLTQRVSWLWFWRPWSSVTVAVMR